MYNNFLVYVVDTILYYYSTDMEIVVKQNSISIRSSQRSQDRRIAIRDLSRSGDKI